MSSCESFFSFQLRNAAQTLLRLSTCCHQIKQLIATKFLGDFIALNEQLLNAAQTLLRLSTCCHQIKQLIATKFLGDFIALNEQLLNLNETVMKQHYEAFILHDICRSDLMYQFVSMMNPLSVARKKMASPRWFTMSLGRRMSEMVMEANGLANLTTALLHEGDANFENSKFVQLLADVISRRPQFLDQGDTRRALYHVNILKQFINLMQRHPAAAKIASWFAASVEAIAAVVPQTAAVCFTDKLLHPWEILFDRNGKMQLWEEGWNRRLDDSFQVLLFYVRGLSPATSMQPVCRMKKLFPLWLSMLGSALYASEQITDIGRSSACKLFTGDLSQLLKRILMDPIFDSDVQRVAFLSDYRLRQNEFEYQNEFVRFRSHEICAN
ncbi:unnamed protein product [Toxocara canis]|uniref:RIH_assoc domain-containing protein n=1 Tax=Toxocara canis TaxID=6265 RepID=A0A183VFC9_TOXCA|nr:unnamed protein product [Toxocara canis]